MKETVYYTCITDCIFQRWLQQCPTCELDTRSTERWGLCHFPLNLEWLCASLVTNRMRQKWCCVRQLRPVQKRWCSFYIVWRDTYFWNPVLPCKKFYHLEVAMLWRSPSYTGKPLVDGNSGDSPNWNLSWWPLPCTGFMSKDTFT